MLDHEDLCGLNCSSEAQLLKIFSIGSKNLLHQHIVKSRKIMQYYIYQNNFEKGPFEELEIEAKLREGTVSSENLARREDESQWHPLSTFFPLYSETSHSWIQDSEDIQSKESKDSYKEPTRQSSNEQEQYTTPPFAPPQPFEQSKPPVQNFVQQFSSYQGEETLPMVAIVGGILSACFMVIGLIPCFGWINWFVLLAGGINIILSIVGISNAKNQNAKNKAIIGLILTVIAICIGLFRLFLGAGCL